jgi:hypothetical protein
VIDPLTETIVSPANAAKTLPIRRAGKRPHVSCIYRWMSSGCKGVILESIQVGGTRCTSREALARFFEALTFGAVDPPSVRSPRQRQRAAEHAMDVLRREGI